MRATTSCGSTTDESVLVAWPFAPLASGETREVRVRAVAASGTETGWSEPLEVTPASSPKGPGSRSRSASQTRLATRSPPSSARASRSSGDLSRAILFYSALGVAEPELNGARVDDDVLAPGWTSYRDRLVHETVDVTALVREGENVLGATIAGAWYTEKYGFFQFADRVYGDQPSLLAQLHLEYADGRTEVVATGDGWQASGDGTVVDSGIYAGEHVDLRRSADVDGWSSPGFDASAWPEARRGASAREGFEHVPVPEARIAPPVRRIDELPVADIITSPSGATILDFGQNLVGRLRITVDGPAGTRLTLRHAEVLEDGELSLRPLRNATATDVLELAGDGRGDLGAALHVPRLPLRRDRGLAGRVRPGRRRRPWCSRATCPARAGSSHRTNCSIACTRTSCGACAATSSRSRPTARSATSASAGRATSRSSRPPRASSRTATRSSHRGCATSRTSSAARTAWFRSSCRRPCPRSASAGPRRPGVMPRPSCRGCCYERFGDLGVLRDAYPSMRDWVDAVLAVIDHPGLWSGHMQLGDWLDPDAPPDKPNKAKVDGDVVASAYLARSLRIVADAAVVLGKAADAEHYATLAERTRAAFVAEYVTPAGRMMSDATTAYALALGFDLVTDAGAAHAPRRPASPSSCASAATASPPASWAPRS